MTKWVTKKLGEIGDIISGGTPATNNEAYWDGDIPFVTPLDLGREKVIDKTIRNVTELGLANSSANKIKANSLAMSTRAPIGLMSIVKNDFSTNQGCKSIQFHEDQDPEFHYYNLSYNVEKIKRYGQGTTFMEISKTDFSSLEFLVPESLAEQRRIAGILSSADGAIAASEALIAKYRNIKRGLLTTLLQPKEGWKKVKLGECCEVNPKTDLSALHSNDEIAFLKMEDVSNDGKITNCNYLKYCFLAKKGFTTFQNEDVIFAKITPCMENGKGALVRNIKSVVGMGSTEFHVLRAKENISIDFIYQISISKHFRLEAEMQMTGSAGQQRVPTAFLEEYEISVPYKNGQPDLAEQRRIAGILSSVDAKIAVEEKVVEKYKGVKKGLMEELLKSNL